MARIPALHQEPDPDDRPLAKVIPFPVRRPKVLHLPAHQVIEEVSTATTLPTRYFATLKRWWNQTPALVKRDAAALVVLAGIAEVVSTAFSPFFVFGLTLVARLLFFAFYSRRVEIRRYEAKVAARSLAYINAVALVAITVVVIQSSAIWRYQAYTYLVFALVMEVISVRTWYTQWAATSEDWNDRDNGWMRIFAPKNGYLLAAFAILITEYVAYGIEWIPLVDSILLFMYHAVIVLYHVVFIIIHIVAALIRAINYIVHHV